MNRSLLLSVSVVLIAAVSGIVIWLKGRDVLPSDALESAQRAGPHEENPEPLPETEIDRRLADYDRRLETDPKNVKVVNERMNFALRYHPEVAAEQCLAILDKDPDHYYALKNMVGACLRLGRTRKALHYAGQAWRVRPDNQSKLLIAAVYMAQGKTGKSKKLYEEVLEEEPGHNVARSALEGLEQEP
ncbi:MAG: hypothetical protein AAF492_08705 [Verrucomicrobiota bacterium]